MIPKVIHYCWFGSNEKPDSVQKCINSWKKYCPDYEIREWNESNYDVNVNAFSGGAYERKKYAFVTDIARLAIVYEHGGFYLDTDVELVRSLDPLAEEKAFFAFEKSEYVATGLGFGAQAGNALVYENLRAYDGKEFIRPDGSLNLEGCPRVTTAVLEKHGLVRNNLTQKIGETKILAPDFFDPFDPVTGVMKKTGNTYAVHWYGQTWASGKARLFNRLARPFHRLFGKDCFSRLKRGKKSL